MTPAELVSFHTRHKLLLMAHCPAAVRTLGQLVAKAGVPGQPAVHAEYAARFEATLAQPLTRGGHANALQHMAGHLRGLLSREERRALADAIERYRSGDTPLGTPIGAVAAHAKRHRVPYLLDQVYLQQISNE